MASLGRRKSSLGDIIASHGRRKPSLGSITTPFGRRIPSLGSITPSSGRLHPPLGSITPSFGRRHSPHSNFIPYSASIIKSTVRLLYFSGWCSPSGARMSQSNKRSVRVPSHNKTFLSAAASSEKKRGEAAAGQVALDRRESNAMN